MQKEEMKVIINMIFLGGNLETEKMVYNNLVYITGCAHKVMQSSSFITFDPYVVILARATCALCVFG